MYVCVCKAITEQEVNSAIQQGCKSLRALNQQLGLGSQCGSCQSHAKQMLRSHSTPAENKGKQKLHEIAVSVA